MQFKKHRDNNRLKREMEGNQKRLREIQGDQVAYSYLSQFSSPARGRALVGLGQVGLILQRAPETAVLLHETCLHVDASATEVHPLFHV